MRKITDIYEEYKIMPNLQMHQFRVAAVALLICENIELEVDRNSIITACLLHDMGNIVKFKLEKFPEFNEPQGLKYWESIKNKFIEKYGVHEHEVTDKILEELNINTYIRKLVDAVQFDKDYAKETENSIDFNRKIVCYSDLRVLPHRISSVEERLADGKARYKDHYTVVEDSNRLSFQNSLKEIENQIFSHTNIKPEDINDESTSKIIEELKNFEI